MKEPHRCSSRTFVTARILTNHLGDRLHGSFIVDNRAERVRGQIGHCIASIEAPVAKSKADPGGISYANPASALLAFVLGPRLEENFRRSVLLTRDSLWTFFERPISAVFPVLCVLLIAGQVYAALRAKKAPIRIPESAFD